MMINRCQRWRRLTMATMMNSLSALESADNGNDDELLSALEAAEDGNDDDVIVNHNDDQPVSPEDNGNTMIKRRGK